MNETKEEIYTKAFLKWGFMPQMGMVVEECAELIQATNKFMRKNDNKSREHFYEELVDVEIMIEQMRIIFNKDKAQIDKIKEKKLERLEKMLEVE